MINLLIVDDTYEKIQLIANFLENRPDCNLDYCLSMKDACSKLSQNSYDVLVVDIQIPEFTGGEINADGGICLIDKIRIDAKLNKPKYILGLTSHKESIEKHKLYFDSFGWPLLLSTNNEKSISELINSKIEYYSSSRINVDVAIITALRKVELEAVLKMPFEWKQIDDYNETIFYLGEFKDRHGEKKSVIAASCPRMGMASSSCLTMKICERFSPKMVFMTGISAGIKDKANIGDILIADPAWDWGNGKRTLVNGEITFQSAPHQLGLSSKHRSMLKELSTSRKYLNEIYDEWTWPGRPDCQLNLHIGPVATGAVVLEDPATVSEIKKQHRETVGIEMEGYGVLLACSEAMNPPEALIVKSVCDYADPEKNDNWQSYAAYTSSKYVEKLLTCII